MHLPPINFDSVTGALFSKLKNVFSTLHQQDTHIVLAGIAFSANFMTKVLKKVFHRMFSPFLLVMPLEMSIFAAICMQAHARRSVRRVHNTFN